MNEDSTIQLSESRSEMQFQDYRCQLPRGKSHVQKLVNQKQIKTVQ